MATVDTTDLGPAHPPKAESFEAFKTIEAELKKNLQHIRHEHNKHEPEYFAAVADLSDEQLTTFSEEDLVEVRTALVAYGLILFGKVHLKEASNGYIHFRAFIPEPGSSEVVKFHSIHTEETEHSDGNKTYRAIFTKNDPLEWFDT
ncbi:hypothetical protein B0O99DRAFT_629745 [Bisporella sp. PMI_857]|nr:hypothetical protein B0O99DRAFT_629745 [Bisporella sp. PMI_857]